MTEKNSETSFIEREHACNTRCFMVVIGLFGVNTGVGIDVLVCNLVHKHVIDITYYIRLYRRSCTYYKHDRTVEIEFFWLAITPSVPVKVESIVTRIQAIHTCLNNG
jgi:hypothetical protein